MTGPKRLLIDIDRLPTLPALALEAMRLAEDDTVSLEAICAVLAKDQVMSSRILAYANSPLYGSGTVRSLSRATALLGLKVVKALILSATVFDSFSGLIRDEAPRLPLFWLHSIGVASTAEALAARLGFAEPEAAYMAGLVHDLGKLVLYLQAPKEFGELCQALSQQGSQPLATGLPLDLEKTCFGLDHGQLGRLLAERWRFPAPLAAAMWLHHQPVSGVIPPDLAHIHQLVHFADLVCVAQQVGSSYFLASEPSCHDQVHFALDALLLAHGMTAADLEAVVKSTQDRVQELGYALGIWDEAAFGRLASEARRRLGSQAVACEEELRQARQANTLLAATTATVRRLTTAATASEAARILAQGAQEVFRVSRVLAMIRESDGEGFCGVMVDGQARHEIRMPVLAAAPTPAAASDRSAIEAEALRLLGQALAEDQAGSQVQSGLLVMVAGSALCSTFLRAERPSPWLASPILGQLLVDFAGSPSAAELSRQEVTRFAATVSGVIQRLLLEERLLRQSDQLAQAAREAGERQRRLFISQRLASVASLAAGMSHEINNPLTIASLNLQILARQLAGWPQAAEAQARFQVITEQHERIATIIEAIMRFARPSRPNCQPVSLGTILAKVESSLPGHGQEPTVQLETHLPPDLPPVMVDPVQIEQVFAALIANARQAMPKGGTVHVAAQVEGAMLAVRVTDTGAGIPRPLLERIFDPFFTTRSQGEGIGLGLAIAHAILEQHGGFLRVTSKEGAGSVFTAGLPLDKANRLRALKAALAEESPSGEEPAAPVRRRLLVAASDRSLRRSLEEGLATAGFEVEGVDDGVEAASRLRQRPFDLLLLDIGLPGPDTQEMVHLLRRAFPQTQVLVASGLASPGEVRELQERGAFACLRKPLAMDDLTATIQAALAQAGAG
ncbi:MAG: HDOD domain-containing protein [Thermodesulfobacteriota bacterium]